MCIRDRHLSVLFSDYTPSRQLQSFDHQLLSQPTDNTVFAGRAFSSTAPRIWNSLPNTIRTASNTNTFRRHPQDSSFLRQHRHQLTVTVRAYDSNFCFDIRRITNADYLLTYLLTSSQCSMACCPVAGSKSSAGIWHVCLAVDHHREHVDSNQGSYRSGKTGKSPEGNLCGQGKVREKYYF